MDEDSPFQDCFIDSPFRHFPLFSIMEPDFSRLQDRIGSFKHWPSFRFRAPTVLARAGFYMLNSETGFIKCFRCGVELRRCYVDDPLDQHERYSPMCSFVLDERKKNPPEPKSESLTSFIEALYSMKEGPAQTQCEKIYIKRRCKVCLSHASNMLLMPCYHLCVCYECYIRLQPLIGPKCPVCRCVFRHGIKVFM